MKRILVRGARQLITLHGHAGPRRGRAMNQLNVIEDGSILIAGGVITHVGPTRRIENLAEARSAEEVNAHGRIVMPGFVDCHTNLIGPPARLLDFPGSSGAHDLLAPVELLQQSLQHVRHTTTAKLAFQTERILAACVMHGTTAIDVKTGYGLNEISEIKMLRVLFELRKKYLDLSATFYGARTTAPEFGSDAEGYLAWLVQYVLPKVRKRRLSNFADVNCDELGFTTREAHWFLQSARTLGFDVRVHTGQDNAKDAVALAANCGAISADGLNSIPRASVDLLANSQTVAVLMPAAVYHGSQGKFAPARDLIEAGAAVALASGFHPTLPATFNMQLVLSLACRYMGMTPEEAICAATVNAAHVIKRSAQTGSIAFGKEANLIMLDVTDYREIAYHYGANMVHTTIYKGEVVYKQGETRWAE
jgi:imidazolonepropionase